MYEEKTYTQSDDDTHKNIKHAAIRDVIQNLGEKIMYKIQFQTLPPSTIMPKNECLKKAK